MLLDHADWPCPSLLNTCGHIDIHALMSSQTNGRQHHKIVRESNDPRKMAYSRMPLNKRGWGAKPASSNLHAVVQCAGC